MDAIPTAEDIKARRVIRFTAGHLAKHADWTGVVVGYNAMYDTVHVYVDAPGNSESGSKITYSRKDVEWCEAEANDSYEGTPADSTETASLAGIARIAADLSKLNDEVEASLTIPADITDAQGRVWKWRDGLYRYGRSAVPRALLAA